jgi:hypothetical protein
MSGGQCSEGCHKFIPQENSRRCLDCGHNDSKHIVVAVKVLMEGYQLLPSPVAVNTPVAKLKERVNLFRREKMTDDSNPQRKVSGWSVAITLYSRH